MQVAEKFTSLIKDLNKIVETTRIGQLSEACNITFEKGTSYISHFYASDISGIKLSDERLLVLCSNCLVICRPSIFQKIEEIFSVYFIPRKLKLLYKMPFHLFRLKYIPENTIIINYHNEDKELKYEFKNQNIVEFLSSYTKAISEYINLSNIIINPSNALELTIHCNLESYPESFECDIILTKSHIRITNPLFECIHSIAGLHIYLIEDNEDIKAFVELRTPQSLSKYFYIRSDLANLTELILKAHDIQLNYLHTLKQPKIENLEKTFNNIAKMFFK